MLLLFLVLLSFRWQPGGAAPAPVLSIYAVSATPTTASNPSKRTLLSLIWSCLSTVFLCAWVSVHPNLPPRSWQSIFWRRLKLMFWAIIAPELMLGWAVRQYYAAKMIANTYKGHGWTMCHGHFVAMGGLVLVHPNVNTPQEPVKPKSRGWLSVFKIWQNFGVEERPDDDENQYENRRQSYENAQQRYLEDKAHFHDQKRSYEKGEQNFRDAKRSYDEGQRSEEERWQFEMDRRIFEDCRQLYEDNRQDFEKNIRHYEEFLNHQEVAIQDKLKEIELKYKEATKRHKEEMSLYDQEEHLFQTAAERYLEQQGEQGSNHQLEKDLYETVRELYKEATRRYEEQETLFEEAGETYQKELRCLTEEEGPFIAEGQVYEQERLTCEADIISHQEEQERYEEARKRYETERQKYEEKRLIDQAVEQADKERERFRNLYEERRRGYERQRQTYEAGRWTDDEKIRRYEGEMWHYERRLRNYEETCRRYELGPLSFDRFRKLIHNSKIEFPEISVEQIQDKSRMDYMAKTIALIQIIWFVLQCIARAGQGLALTELELVTLALASLNVVTYIYWWDKPLGTQDPVKIFLRTTPEERIEETGNLPFEIGQNINARVPVMTELANIGTFLRSFGLYVLEFIQNPLKEGLVWAIFNIFIGTPLLLSSGLFLMFFPPALAVLLAIIQTTQPTKPDYKSFEGHYPIATRINHFLRTTWYELTTSISDFFHARLNRIGSPFKFFLRSCIVFPLLFFSLLLLFVLIVPFFLLFFVTVLFTSMFSISTTNTIEAGAKAVPVFYAPKTDRDRYSRMFVFALFGVIFGGLHCTGWLLEYPDRYERTLWIVASITITAIPAIVFPIDFLLESNTREGHNHSWPTRMVHNAMDFVMMILLFVYILARFSLIGQAFALLRSQPASTFVLVDWTRYIPHI